jgi:nitrite reductase/ring-hydroxylating ferredoxin subunit
LIDNQNAPAPGTDLCPLDELADGSGRAFTWGAGKNAFSVIVLRCGESVKAFVNICPHFQISLDQNTRVTTFREFVLCSHHHAAFRMSDGYCVEGPCEGAALTPMPIVVEGGRIRIGSQSGDTKTR